MDTELTPGALLASSLVMGIVGLGIVHWVMALVRLRNGQSLVPWEPRRQVPWGLFDLFIAVALVIGGAIVTARLMQAVGLLPEKLQLADATAQQTALLILADGASRLLIMPVLLVLIAVRTGATAKDFGFVPRKIASDIRLGFVAFTMLLPIVFAIQAVLTRFQKYEHELLKVLGELPGWQWAVAMTFVAGVSAPIAEEILFRLLLQGWLEKLIGFRGPTHELVLGPVRRQTFEAAEPMAEPPGGLNPYESPHAASAETSSAAPVEFAHDDGESVPPALRRFGWIAIAISSIIFALLHWSHGPAWVALTVLAAGMGFLYQRTHRILPSLVVHALLNNLTMLIVLLDPKQGA